jgi:hypothetical protein
VSVILIYILIILISYKILQHIVSVPVAQKQCIHTKCKPALTYQYTVFVLLYGDGTETVY